MPILQLTRFDYGQKPSTAQTIEIDAMCDMSNRGDSFAAYDSQHNTLPDLHRGVSTESIAVTVSITSL